MKPFFRATSMEMSYGVRSIRFWGTVAAMTVLMLLDLVQMMCITVWSTDFKAAADYIDILTLMLDLFMTGAYMFWLRFCLFAVPFGGCFYDDYSGKCSKYRLTRSSTRVYGMSKMAAGTILSGAMVILSDLIVCIILKLMGFTFLFPEEFAEIAEGEWISVSPTYYRFMLVEGGHPVLFFVLLLIFSALPAVFFSAMTIMLSAYIRNRYILMAVPLALFFSLDSLLQLFFYPKSEAPVLFNWEIMFFNMLLADEHKTELLGFARTLLYTIAGVAVFSFFFLRKIREVSENE